MIDPSDYFLKMPVSGSDAQTREPIQHKMSLDSSCYSIASSKTPLQKKGFHSMTKERAYNCLAELEKNVNIDDEEGQRHRY